MKALNHQGKALTPFITHSRKRWFHHPATLDAGHKFNVHKTSSECLMYIQFASCVQSVNIILAQVTFLADNIIRVFPPINNI